MARRRLAVAGAALFVSVAASGAATVEQADGEFFILVQNEDQKAQRRRMRDCGAQWQRVKADGKARGRTWSQFRAECMRRAS